MSLNLWPTGAAFSQSLDCPSFAFDDSDWKQAVIAYRDPRSHGKIMMSGRFATVFKATLPGNKTWAVRVFTSKSAERQTRYEAISQHVNPVATDSPFVEFEYRQKGIRNIQDGKWYPMVIMKWVEGISMFEWVTKQCQANNTAQLLAALPKWVGVMAYLKEHGIVHGDLQHETITFTDNDEIILDSYHGMSVPTLQDLGALEAGMEPYQHPTRGDDAKLGIICDDFSAIFIYVAIAALAEAPNLWLEFVLDQDYEKLLFKKEDLESPGTSALFSAIKTQAPDAYQMSLQLAEIRNGDIADVPAFEDFLFTWGSVYGALENKEQVEEIVKELTVDQQLSRARDNNMRLQTELDNLGKRSKREMQQQLKYTALPVISEMLSVIDDLHRTLEASQSRSDVDAFTGGLEIVIQSFTTVLEKYQCRAIEAAAGVPFDVKLHEAISVQPSDQFDANVILAVVQQGYQMHDRVIRPCQVIVSSGPAWDKAAAIAHALNKHPKVMVSGRFATVFKVEVRNKNWAVRVFTSKSPEREYRYSEISQYVNPVSADSPFVEFEYLQEGIRNVKDGKGYPLMFMEWVQGVTMFEWLTKQCQSNNTAKLQAALPKWVAVMAYLKEHDIAHGDLQHGNIMFTDNDKIKLVDYDGMCVPSLQGEDTREAGMPPYQHPSRGVDTKLSSTLDDFSAIFIYVAMHALAEAPNLWQQFVLDLDYEKMLFQQEDLESPSTSRLFNTLKIQAPVAYEMSLELARLYTGNIADVPALEDFLFTWDSVYDALKEKDYRAVVTLADEAGFREPPADLVQVIKNAGNRVSCLDAIMPILESANERGIASLFDAKLLGDWPESKPLLSDIDAAMAIPPIYEKIYPLDKAGKWADFLLGYNSEKAKLDAYPRGCLSTELRVLRQRIESCDGVLRNLERLVKEDDPGVLELKQALDTLTTEGPHPEAPGGLLERAGDLLKRAEKWKDWLGVHASSVQQQRDNALVDAWDEKVFGDWVVSSPYRDDLIQAEARLAIVKELGDLVGNDLKNVAYEQSLIEKSKMLPSGYQHSFGSRIDEAKTRIATLAVIIELLVEKPIHEFKLSQQWKILLKQSSTSLLVDDRRKRCELALKRAPYIVQLSQLPPKTELAKRDVALCKCWNKDLLDDCHQVAALKPHLAAAHKRLVSVKKIQDAVTAENEIAYMAFATEEVLTPYEEAGGFDELIQCSPVFSELLAQTKDNHRKVDNLKSAINEGDGEKFIKLYDQQFMERYQESFAEVEDVLTEFIQNEVVPKIRFKKIDPDEPASDDEDVIDDDDVLDEDDEDVLDDEDDDEEDDG